MRFRNKKNGEVVINKRYNVSVLYKIFVYLFSINLKDFLVCLRVV